MARARKGSSPSTWRPNDRRGRVCGYTFDETTCRRRGAHYCQPRADRVVAFFAELLVHTKGPYARQKFTLTNWQERDIIRPLFGEVIWSVEWGHYVRRFRIAHIVLGRKNGKSELMAAIVLYLLAGDDEESAEIYGAAKDTKQAGKVFEPAWRMVELSPVLRKRLKLNKHSRRIIDERTASYYEIITADAEGELGHNPHGFILDEVLAQPDDSLWNSMRTASGARTQPLMLCITTETNEPVSFGASMIDEAERVQQDPARAPHVFAYVRKLARDADPWDERNWYQPNPALGTFLSITSLREEALEARNDATRENAFRQFRLNQRVSQSTRFISLTAWDANAGETTPGPEWVAPKLEGGRAVAGLDLSAREDFTAWCLLFDNGWAWWRYWLPEATLERLDGYMSGKLDQWARQGWITVTEGDVIDYERIYADVATDAARFRIGRVIFDKWSGEPVRQRIEADTRLELMESATTYEHMTAPMKELRRVLTAGELAHGDNPVSRWHADGLEAKSPRDDPDRMRPVKPARAPDGHRIDGMAALLFAIEAKVRFADKPKPEPRVRVLGA